MKKVKITFEELEPQKKDHWKFDYVVDVSTADQIERDLLRQILAELKGKK